MQPMWTSMLMFPVESGGAFENLSEYRTKLTAWKDKAVQHKWIIDMWIYLGYGFAIFCAQVLGFIWVSAFSIILATAIIIGMVVFFLFFSIIYAARCAFEITHFILEEGNCL